MLSVTSSSYHTGHCRMHFKIENITIPFVKIVTVAKLFNDLPRIIQAETAQQGNTGQANTLITEPASPLAILNNNNKIKKNKKEERGKCMPKWARLKRLDEHNF